MGKVRAYLNETIDELFNKVSWPSWSELQSSAIVVMIASVIISLVVWGMDMVFTYGMKTIYNIFS